MLHGLAGMRSTGVPDFGSCSLNGDVVERGGTPVERVLTGFVRGVVERVPAKRSGWRLYHCCDFLSHAQTIALVFRKNGGG